MLNSLHANFLKDLPDSPAAEVSAFQAQSTIGFCSDLFNIVIFLQMGIAEPDVVNIEFEMPSKSGASFTQKDAPQEATGEMSAIIDDIASEANRVLKVPAYGYWKAKVRMFMQSTKLFPAGRRFPKA